MNKGPTGPFFMVQSPCALPRERRPRDMSKMKQVAIILKDMAMVRNSTHLTEQQKNQLLSEAQKEIDAKLGQGALPLETPAKKA